MLPSRWPKNETIKANLSVRITKSKVKVIISTYIVEKQQKSQRDGILN